jgi:hypothetical protein
MRHRITACLLAFTAALIVAVPAAARPEIVSPPTPASATCVKQVTFALLDARTTGCLVPVSTNPDVWDSTDLVNVNGIPIQAVTGTKLVLKAPTPSAPGGTIAVNTSITLGGATVFSGTFDQVLPAGGPGDLKPLATLSPPAGTKIKGFSLGGSVSVMLGKDATGDQQGYARFELIVKLPDAFKNGPGQGAGGLTGTAAIRTDATGVHADTLKLEIANAYVGQVLLKNVCLSFVASASLASPCQPPKFGATPLLECKTTGTDRWDGSALIQLPTADKPEVGVFAGVSNGSFAYAGAQVTNLGTSAPLVQGVYLDKIGLAICVNPAPTTIKGALGLRFGPSFNGTSAAYLTGSIQYTDSRPWVIQAKGSLALYGKDVATGYFTYKSDGAIDFGFAVAWNFYGVLDLNGAVNGWYQPARTVTTYGLDLRDPVNQQRNAAYQACVKSVLACLFSGRLASSQAGLAQIPRIATGQTTEAAKFDVFGNAKVCVVKIVCVGGEAAVSSVGVAGCAEITVFGYPKPYFWGVRWVPVKVRAGAGYKWGNGTKVDTMGNSCDVGGYRAQKSAQIAASGVTTVELARAPAVALKITGRGSAPRVSFTSPDGSRIIANGAGQLKRNKYYFVEDPRADTTSIVIVRPAPGAWTIHTLPGSSPVTGVAQAPVTPDPSAAARVIDHGSTRELQYELESDPNHTVTFVERGGNYEQELGTAKGRPCLKNAPIQGKRPSNAYMAHPSITCGLIAFKPAAGPAGVRNIVAVVTDHGEPVDEFKVASYQAPGEGTPAQPANLRITRQGTTVDITWDRSAGADDYDVDITLSDGTKVVDVMGSKARHVVVNDVPQGLDVTATVRGLRGDDVQGPMAQASSKA